MDAPDRLDVLVLAGGRSSERDVSLRSGEAVRRGLAEIGHRPRAVEIAGDGSWFEVEAFRAPAVAGESPSPAREAAPEPLAAGTTGPATAPPAGGAGPLSVTPGRGALGADVVFPVLHGPFGEDGVTQGLLESLDVPYVGAGVAASAVCLNKLVFKDLMAHAGVPQVDYRRVDAADWLGGDTRRDICRRAFAPLGFPLFVKPARLGSSVGISRVGDAGELDAAIDLAVAHDPQVIVEAGSSGAEIECSVIGNTELTVSRPGVLEFDAEWYDFDSKYERGGMRLVAPARVSERLEIEVCSLAARVYRLVGCAGLARVDFFVEDDDRVLVNELNTLPGFTETSVFARLFSASGMDYGELLDRLLKLALERHAEERRFRF